MKKFVICLFCFNAVALMTSAQNVSRCSCDMRIGDVMIVEELKTDDLWNLSEAELSDKKYVDAYYGIGTDTIVRVVRNTQYHYIQRNDSVSLIGFENKQFKLRHNIPELILRLPFWNDDALTGIYESYGLYCDRFETKATGSYKTRVTRTSTLILPSGDSIANVVNVRTERQYMLSPKDKVSRIYNGGGKLIEKKTEEKVSRSPIQLSETVDRLYASAYRYPIVERTVISDKHNSGNVIKDVTLYCPPDMQDQLTLDEQLGNEQSGDYDGRDIEGLWDKDVEDIGKYIRNNPDAKYLSLKYASRIATNGVAILADISGVVHKVVRFHGEGGNEVEVEIDYSRLCRCPCTLFVEINGKQYQHSFFSK